MNHTFKSIFVTLMLTIALNSSFCQVTQKHTIRLSLNPTGVLIVDPDSVGVVKGDIVRWEIAPGQNISEFAIAGDDRHPFTHNLPVKMSDTLERTVWKWAPEDDWQYNVFFRLSTDSTTQRSLDPKISVNPVLLLSKAPGLPVSSILNIIFGVLIIIAITIMMFSRRSRNRVNS